MLQFPIRKCFYQLNFISNFKIFKFDLISFDFMLDFLSLKLLKSFY